MQMSSTLGDLATVGRFSVSAPKVASSVLDPPAAPHAMKIVVAIRMQFLTVGILRIPYGLSRESPGH